MSMMDRWRTRRQSTRNVPELRTELHNTVDELFRRAWSEPFGLMEPGMPTGMGMFQPRLELEEDDENLYVTAEIPGMNREDVEVRMQSGQLLLRGEKKQEEEKKERGVTHSERRYGFFERRIPLPAEIDQDKCQASYRDGLLEVTLPKTEQSRKQSRRIDVKG